MPFGYPEDNPSAASLERKKKLELNEVPLSLLSFVLFRSLSLVVCPNGFPAKKEKNFTFFFAGTQRMRKPLPVDVMEGEREKKKEEQKEKEVNEINNSCCFERL